MEALNIAMMEAKIAGLYDGVNLANNGPTVSHFLFADDTLFVGNWFLQKLSNLLRILRCFHLASDISAPIFFPFIEFLRWLCLSLKV